MPETKQIPTITTLTTQGSDIVIFTRFFETGLLPNTINGFISSSVSSQDGTFFIENELLIQMQNFPEKINYTVNDQGELIVLSTTGDVDNYTINGNGDLIWSGETVI